MIEFVAGMSVGAIVGIIVGGMLVYGLLNTILPPVTDTYEDEQKDLFK